MRYTFTEFNESVVVSVGGTPIMILNSSLGDIKKRHPLCLDIPDNIVGEVLTRFNLTKINVVPSVIFDRTLNKLVNEYYGIVGALC